MREPDVPPGTTTHGGERPRGLAAALLSTATLVWTFAIVLAVVLLWWGGDRWWPGTILLFGPRWVLGLPVVVLLPAILILDRSLLAPLALGLVLYFVPLLGLRISGPGEEDARDLIAVTMNLAGGRELKRPLPELVAESGADLVAIQECPFRARRDPDGLRVTGYQSHSYGSLCFLSRFPFQVGARTGGGLTPDSATGLAVRYDVALAAGDTISVTNLHLPTPRSGLEDVRMGRLRTGAEELERYRRLRIRGARDARLVADQGHARRVVLGDFNAPPESRIQRQYWGDYDNAFADVGLGFGFTRYNGWIRARIDHVLLAGGLEAVSATVTDDVGSDHRPVRVRIRRGRQAASEPAEASESPGSR